MWRSQYYSQMPQQYTCYDHHSKHVIHCGVKVVGKTLPLH
jgi:hypothetical protein